MSLCNKVRCEKKKWDSFIPTFDSLPRTKNWKFKIRREKSPWLFHFKFGEFKFHFSPAFKNFLIFRHSVERVFLVEKAETILFDEYGVREKE